MPCSARPRVSGSCALYVRRKLYLPNSESSEEEIRAAKERGNGAHRLAFIEAVFNYEQGFFRFDIKHVASIAALLLKAFRGPHYTGMDTPASLSRLAHTLCPAYATQDCCRDHHFVHNGMLPMAGAPRSSELGAMILTDLEALPSTMSVLAAEESFMSIVRSSELYGSNVFPAQKVMDNPEEGAESLQEVLISVGHFGLCVISQAAPLEVLLMTTYPNILYFGADVKRGLLLLSIQELPPNGDHGGRGGGGGGEEEGGGEEGAGEGPEQVVFSSPNPSSIVAAMERYMSALLDADEQGAGAGSGVTFPSRREARVPLRPFPLFRRSF